MPRLAVANVRASPALAAAARRGSPSISRAAAAPALPPRGSRPASRLPRRSAVFVASSSASAAAALDAVADAIDEATGEKTREIKAQLLDSLFGTERGLSASSEVRRFRGRERAEKRKGMGQTTKNLDADVSP